MKCKTTKKPLDCQITVALLNKGEIMKPSKIRKMKREMANAHNVKRGEIQRVTNAMYKVGHNFKFKLKF